MARMKNVVDRTYWGTPIVEDHKIHVHKYHRKKPCIIVPIIKSEWVHKPGKKSWLARRER